MADVDPVLVQLVLDAVPATLAAIAAAHPGERIVGYALGTDDDLCTVFHVATSAERSRPEHAFSFNEWPYYDGEEHLEAAQAHIRAAYDAATGHAFAAHVEGSFASLVEALAVARARGVFASDVFLDVGSTDPGPPLDAMEEQACLRLNVGAVRRAWCLQHIAWAESRIAYAASATRLFESERAEIIERAKTRIERFRRILDEA